MIRQDPSDFYYLGPGSMAMIRSQFGSTPDPYWRHADSENDQLQYDLFATVFISSCIKFCLICDFVEINPPITPKSQFL